MTIEITAPTIHEAAFNSLQAYIIEGRLAQGTWGHIEDGKDVACLLGAAVGIRDAGECPAELMPPWLAYLTPALFDGLPDAAIPPIASRYANCMRYWGKITADGWERIRSRYLIHAITLAVDGVPTIVKAEELWHAIAEAVEACKEAIGGGGADTAYNAAHNAHDAGWAVQGVGWAADAARAAADAAASAVFAAAPDDFGGDDDEEAASYAADASNAAVRAAYNAAFYAADAASCDAVTRATTAYASSHAAYESLFVALLTEIEATLQEPSK